MNFKIEEDLKFWSIEVEPNLAISVSKPVISFADNKARIGKPVSISWVYENNGTVKKARLFALALIQAAAKAVEIEAEALEFCKQYKGDTPQEIHAEIEEACIVRRGGTDLVYLKIANKDNPLPGTPGHYLSFSFEVTSGEGPAYLKKNFGIENITIVDVDHFKS